MALIIGSKQVEPQFKFILKPSCSLLMTLTLAPSFLKILTAQVVADP